MEYLFEQQSMMISSLSADGFPEISYAPFVKDGINIYFYLSAAANHYVNLSENPKCSVMSLVDEKDAKNIFARNRVSFKCNVEKVDVIAENIEAIYEERHGKANYQHLKQMHDFSWFKLTVQSGRLVEGFGKAFDIAVVGDQMELIPITKGHGHAAKKTA
ncbi:MAG: pyridoxamine 5'-phosphate oxidase family protein [Turicibacter sp.]|nr:pyridoxamine 5'-phosphate oxidase family protein [Turicibacter sp.]